MLNEQQQKVVRTIEGPVLVLAGAGSGKTKVLVNRVENIIKKGASARNILVITFTNKAATEIKSRIVKALGKKGENVNIGTFHSICMNILQSEISYTQYELGFEFIEGGKQIAIVEKALANLKMDEFTVPEVLSVISDYKTKLLSPKKIIENALNDEQKKLGLVYQHYQEILVANNCLDFDDLIFETIRMFYRYPEVLDRWQEKLKYIMVDEYQDSNYAQYRFLKLLASKYQNLCVVGDDDQSIYRFRGADIQCILDFEKDFSNAEIIQLEQNYRNTKVIVTASSAVIQHNTKRKNKAVFTENEEGEKLILKSNRTDREEAQFIANEIKKLKEQGKQYKEICILFRANKQCKVIEETLKKNNIPYCVPNKPKFLVSETELENYDDMEKETKNQVVLLTIHSSKGLEFPIVFITGMEEGIFPSHHCVGSIDELEEERRLLYVAMTRARKKLYLTYSNKRIIKGKVKNSIVSRFIKEIPEDLIVNYDLNPKEEKASDIEIVEVINPTQIKHNKYGVGKVISLKPSMNYFRTEIKFSDKVRILKCKFA